MALLARFFGWLDRVLGARGAERDHSGFVNRAAFPAMTRLPVPARERAPSGTLLSVDGGGQYLLCAAERLTLGHLRAGRADLVFLADLGPLHALLERADSLQAGPGWRIAPCGGERVLVAGAPVPAEGRRLAGGERVRLGENFEFRLTFPDPASASAVLELLHGVECAGARHILLLAPGAGGRVRIGAALAHHVRVPGLDFELALEWHARELHLESTLPLAGVEPGARLGIALPPRARQAFSTLRAPGSRPPFGFSLEPVVFP